MKFPLFALLVFAVLGVIGCGEDSCDPTGVFGCQQYTSESKVEMANRTDEILSFDFKPCTCCSKGKAAWDVAPGQTYSKSLTIVDEGGGDGCDESAELSRLIVKSPFGSCQIEYLQQPIVGFCDEKGCYFGELGAKAWPQI